MRLFALLAVFALATSASVAQSLALKDVTVINVVDGVEEPDRTVVVEDGRIAIVAESGAVNIPSEAMIVEANGQYVIPGLWDMHTHFVREQNVESTSRLLIANGITGARDMFGSREVADRTKASIAAGKLSGPPRLVVAGNLVDGPNSFVAGALSVETPEEGRNIVDSLYSAGAPFVKMYSGLMPETHAAIVERSNEIGIPAVGHVPIMVRAEEASNLGQRSFEHMIGMVEGCSIEEAAVLDDWEAILGSRDRRAIVQRFMEPIERALASQNDEHCRRLLELFVENETWQVPTLVSLRGKAYLRELAAEGDPRVRYFTPSARWTGGRPFGFPMSEEQWESFQMQYEREKEIVGLMADVGVPILAGSDMGTPWVFPGFGLHDELELLVDAGLTPHDALKSATINPARFFGRSEELGTVEEGKLADLVLLAANPLQDITNTQRIRAVVADGVFYDRTDLDRLLAEVEESVEQTDPPE